MDLSFDESYQAFRREVADFLAAHWPKKPGPGEAGAKPDSRAFRLAATGRGYLYRGVPRAYGGSEQPSDPLKAQIIREEFARVRAPMEVPGLGMMMLVPTLLERGTDWQKELFIPPTLTGDFRWAQGYSEPGSGSDLASLRTRAVLDGDDWVIEGQKLWTTEAHIGTHMFMLVRTEPDAPKHQGISYLLLDLRQPGVTIRPLKQMNGDAEFNEVFFDGARTPANWIVGERGKGWEVSKTTLKHERGSVGGADASAHLFARLVDLARAAERDGVPAIRRPEVRQALARLEGYVLAQKYTTYRQFSMTLAGRNPGIGALMNKLIGTNIGHDVAKLAQELIGDDLLLMPPLGKDGGRDGNARWVNQIMGSLGVAIAGGTSNIQRNIIAERGLGLPRDPAGKDA